MDSSGASRRIPLDWKTERDTAIGLTDGKRTEVLRVFYRRPPTRRWTRFLLVPDEGQTLEDLEEAAFDAAVLHAMRLEGTATRDD